MGERRGSADDFALYLDVLVRSWKALAVAQPEASVIRDVGYIVARFPDAVLNNAVILDPSALDQIQSLYQNTHDYAVWSHHDDHTMAAPLEMAGFRRDTTTRPMLCRLDDLDIGAVADGNRQVRVLRGVDPTVVARLNGLRADFFGGVAGLTAYANDDHHSGLVVFETGPDTCISAVATRPESRGRGLATAITRRVLEDSRDRGFLTASLQATAAAENLYLRLGFRPLGRWQEWVRRRI